MKYAKFSYTLFIFLGVVISIPFLRWSAYPLWVIALVSFGGGLLCSIGVMINDNQSCRRLMENYPRQTLASSFASAIKAESHELPSELLELKPEQPCVHCGSNQVAEIVYGMPALTLEIKRELEAKRIILAGCMIYDKAPQWHCHQCGCDFGHFYAFKS